MVNYRYTHSLRIVYNNISRKPRTQNTHTCDSLNEKEKKKKQRRIILAFVLI